ncbi:hypothetical protein V7S43_018594 [Phytophthora oleae]|uniref:Pectate lyase n=1 Tax=Phytophthora oleae TaxID=2107226 RepID=A0ABD3ETT3_9STRA
MTKALAAVKFTQGDEGATDCDKGQRGNGLNYCGELRLRTTMNMQQVETCAVGPG